MAKSRSTRAFGSAGPSVEEIAPPPKSTRRAPAPPPPPEELSPEFDDQYYYDDSPVGGALWFFFMATLLSLIVIGGGIYALKEITDRGYLDQYQYVFQQIDLLPTNTIRPASLDAALQVFVSEDGRSLTPRLYRLRRDMSADERDRIILDQLFSGPQGSERRIIPEGTNVRAFYRYGTTAYLDLTEQALEAGNTSARDERLTIYSMINSLVLNNPDINAVQILIEGKPIESLWGWLDCSSPLGADLSLLRS